MMAYLIVKTKEVTTMRTRLADLQLLQTDIRILKINGEERGIPLCDSAQLKEAVESERLEVDGASYRIYKRLDLPQEIPKKPYDLMKMFVEDILKRKRLWREELAKEIPKSWTKYGDTVLFDSKSYVDPVWNTAGEELWLSICAALSVKKLGRKNRIQPDGFRTPKVELIWGSNSWASAIDGEIRYGWDVNLCMFSAGNGTERCRISNMDCRGETVVDLYAGVGYFTLPFLIHAEANYVHACEWNPDALMALRYNLVMNKVEDRCCVYKGDNREVCPQNIADRVYMGLIPTCEPGITTGCKALKFHLGGVLHIHENVSSYRKRISENQPSTSSDSGETLPIPINDLPSVPPCQQCHSILMNFPKALMHDIENAFEDLSNIAWKDKFAMSFSLEGPICDPEWCKDSQIVWKRREWFLQALHSAHIVCRFLSSFHGCPWRVEIINLERVKSYAPHIDHLVFDLKCTPVK